MNGHGIGCIPSSFYHLVIDSHNPHALARFGSAGWTSRSCSTDDEVMVGAHKDAYPRVCFVTVPEARTIKNRLHIDLDPDDPEAEVARVLALGARHADVGQGHVPWVVLTDPEGNEFCILQPHRSLID